MDTYARRRSGDVARSRAGQRVITNIDECSIKVPTVAPEQDGRVPPAV